MPEFRVKPGKTKSGRHKKEAIFSEEEKKILKVVGNSIHDHLIEIGRSLDWLSLQTGVARSAIIKIKQGQTNVGILTLNQIVQGLGYKDVFEFLRVLKK